MSKTLKSVLIVVLAISLMIVAVMGWHWTDLAKTPFWWTFWVVAAIASLIGFVLLIKWYGSSNNQN